ncbi:MAG: hypothetical protein QXU82_01760 [Candidatus Aenigmatarchaeota archaeon]
MMKFASIRPELFISLSMLFLVAGLATIFNPYFSAVNPNLSFSPLSLFVWLFAACSFMLGLRYGGGIFRLRQLPALVIFIAGVAHFSSYYSMPLYASLAFSLAGAAIAYFVVNFNGDFLKLFLAGVALLILNMAAFGVPLLNVQLHVASSRGFLGFADFTNPVFIAGFYLALYSLVRLHARADRRMFWLLAAALLALAALSSFRLYPTLVLITAVLLEMKSSAPKPRQMLLLSLIAVAFVGFFLLVGSSLETAKGNEIGGPLEVAEYRAGFTLHVFDDIVKKSFPLGYAFGSTYFTAGGGDMAICGLLYGCTSRITSTAFGEIMLNFGLPGVFLLAFFMAAVLGKLYEKDYPLYALGMANAIAAIEIGMNVPFMLLFAILYLRLIGWIPSRRPD